jgi:hypothetical protein
MTTASLARARSVDGRSARLVTCDSRNGVGRGHCGMSVLRHLEINAALARQFQGPDAR